MRDIFTIDIESVPHREFWPGKANYPIKSYWLEQRFEDCRRANFGSGDPDEGTLADWRAEVTEALANGSAPMKSTGEIPACHPATAHIISVSTGIHMAKTRDADIRTNQIDDFAPMLEEPYVGDEEGQDPLVRRLRRLDEYDEKMLRTAERKVVQLTLEQMHWAYAQGMTVVTFNGTEFDLPMMRWRSVMLGQKVLPDFKWEGPGYGGRPSGLLYPYDTSAHCDLRLVLSSGDRRATGTLELWCKAFGITSEESGGKVIQWAMRGEWDEIRRYGSIEMTSMIDLYRAIESAL